LYYQDKLPIQHYNFTLFTTLNKLIVRCVGLEVKTPDQKYGDKARSMGGHIVFLSEKSTYICDITFNKLYIVLITITIKLDISPQSIK
jgi:hypothetical protein